MASWDGYWRSPGNCVSRRVEMSHAGWDEPMRAIAGCMAPPDLMLGRLVTPTMRSSFCRLTQPLRMAAWASSVRVDRAIRPYTLVLRKIEWRMADRLGHDHVGRNLTSFRNWPGYAIAGRTRVEAMQVRRGRFSGMRNVQTLDMIPAILCSNERSNDPGPAQFIIILIVIQRRRSGRVEPITGPLPNDRVVALEVFDRAVTFCVLPSRSCLKTFRYRVKSSAPAGTGSDFVFIGVSMLPGGRRLQCPAPPLRFVGLFFFFFVPGGRPVRLLHIIPMMKRITEALIETRCPAPGRRLCRLALVTYVRCGHRPPTVWRHD